MASRWRNGNDADSPGTEGQVTLGGGDSDSGIWARYAWFNEQLKAGRYPRPSQMAKVFGVSVDTARRTIERFERHLGAPIAYDPSKKGYYYPEGCRAVELPPLWMTDPASHVLLCGLALMGHGVRHGDAFAGQLAALLPGKYGRLAGRLAVETHEHHPPDREVFLLILEAMVSDRTLDLVYQAKEREEPTPRVIEPLVLHNINGNWFLYAWCRFRKERRNFALGRIRGLPVLGGLFDFEAHVAKEDPLSDVQGVFGQHKRAGRQWARVRFSAAAARWIREETWHPEARVTPLPDGGLELELPYGADGLDIIRAVLPYGPEAEVVAPEELRARAQAVVAGTLERYRRPPAAD
ncbi:MAG: WYL domain-containing protein [Candidatus Sericytochromatia bacterium]|nr:WYL domain-containing protein [Candidatus Sericytochromatia bacterium]